MAASDLEQAIDEYHNAVAAFIRGDTEPQKRLFSHRDDVTLANPLGPPVRGWGQVEEALELAASLLREGEISNVERISDYATPDLAYILEIERARIKTNDAGEFASTSLRVTTIFRREEDGWRVVHRHADPTTTPRSLDSILHQ